MTGAARNATVTDANVQTRQAAPRHVRRFKDISLAPER